MIILVVTKTRYGNYVELAGTAGEVLQALSDENVFPKDMILIAADSTYAVFRRGAA